MRGEKKQHAAHQLPPANSHEVAWVCRSNQSSHLGEGGRFPGRATAQSRKPLSAPGLKYKGQQEFMVTITTKYWQADSESVSTYPIVCIQIKKTLFSKDKDESKKDTVNTTWVNA